MILQNPYCKELCKGRWITGHIAGTQQLPYISFFMRSHREPLELESFGEIKFFPIEGNLLILHSKNGLCIVTEAISLELFSVQGMHKHLGSDGTEASMSQWCLTHLTIKVTTAFWPLT